ncbi:winged helix-turn-helix transcriptional regulator [Geoalkalibacter halelectricus]|uniref:Helix-turn-helix transcriptional regulator n=1 Tax=Geoalkalibacter halelectricus TaxID=2847045 RepID=A0ABY5ZNK4_9BACT|nr:helix-turn-helix domain-containing protein [Geoalkalibacter halelectricus]MDO3377559.1 helix-turn-helix transcriptional regulator [Geoalkalibacter halelectricus]UWZ80683.1 helix-turn-helix transcriptional regulator [Geoalkalibacter halelectricus]
MVKIGENTQEKNIQSGRSNYRKLEEVLGCKWSVSVLLAVKRGISRPGALERDIQGISTKVLTERLRKLTDYGLLRKQIFAEVPPRTEYSLTSAGLTLTDIIAQVHRLDEQLREKPLEERKGGKTGSDQTKPLNSRLKT